MTSTKLKIASNTIYQIIGRFSTAFSTLIITALITRYLGVKTFGEYSIVIAYITIFFTLSDFGVNAVVIKEFADDKNSARGNFRKILTLRIIYGLVLAFISGLIVFVMPYSANVKLAVYIGLPLLILNSVSKAAAVIFQSYLEYKMQAIALSIGAILSVFIVGFSIFVSMHSLPFIIFLTVIGSSIAPLLSIYFVRSYILVDSAWFDFEYWKKVLFDSLPIGISLILNTFMIQVDRLLLSIMSSTESVGVYSLSYKIFELVLVLPIFIMNSAYPVLVLLKRSDLIKYKKSALTLIKFMILCSVLLTSFGLLLSDFLIPLIWGEGMKNSVLAFNILILGSIFFFISAPLSWIILVEGKHRILPYIYGVGFLINLFLNIIFIPKFDYMGAAYITVLTEALIVALLTVSVYPYFKNKSMTKSDLNGLCG